METPNGGGFFDASFTAAKKGPRSCLPNAGYSYLSATIGSTLAARRAGR